MIGVAAAGVRFTVPLNVISELIRVRPPRVVPVKMVTKLHPVCKLYEKTVGLKARGPAGEDKMLVMLGASARHQNQSTQLTYLTKFGNRTVLKLSVRLM